nr:ionotropic receptor [Odontothrips loti]
MVSARITFITMFVANVFLFTSFSGSIVAIIQSPSNALRNVQDLIESDMNVHVQEIRFTHVWFEEAEAENDVAAEIFRKKIKTHKPPGFVVTREGIKSVRRGKHAFLVETNEGYKEILDTFMEAEKCDLSELDLFPTAPRVICTTEKSPYREVAARNILWQREAGLLSRIQSRWESQRPECSGLSQAFVPIGLQEFYPALIVLYNGVLLAVVVLLAERVYKSKSAHQRRAVTWSISVLRLGIKTRRSAKPEAF